ncbi:MAG: ABC transporter ATP-binding protein [Spirochaetaceae bacterium]|nr:ABC transporter ATP-binding protein [Spirochaetaceae bacterium]
MSVQLGGTAVLEDVSLTAGAGEIVALLGPSGCGKTTLLRVIAGLQPHAGDVRWQGRSLAATPAHRRGFGLVFQDQALFPHLEVARNVAFGLRMQPRTRHGGAAERGRRVAELLDLVGLSGFSRRPVDSLSGGEAQRVALARALAPHPRLLMLDEPLSGLDRPLREQLLVDLPRILRRLRQTALFVTHDLEEALAVSDRVAVMRAGRVVQVGTPRALYERPASVFVARFLGRANILSGKVLAAGSERTAASDRADPQAGSSPPDGAGSPAGGGLPATGHTRPRLLETGIGLLPYAGPAGPGERGTVLLRPERISLATTDLGPQPSGHPAAAGAAGPRHTLYGTLRDTSFRGIAALATITVGSTSLQVLVPAGRTLPAAGAPVTVSFDPRSAVVPLADSR